MCNCKTWCRDWSETMGGKYPKSEHAPGCEDYKTEPFVRLEFDGSSCTMEPADAEVMISVSDVEYKQSTVMLTRDQFENMEEFSGF